MEDQTEMIPTFLREGYNLDFKSQEKLQGKQEVFFRIVLKIMEYFDFTLNVSKKGKKKKKSKKKGKQDRTREFQNVAVKELFGYYKFDKTRKVFLIFSSISCKFYQTNQLIPLKVKNVTFGFGYQNTRDLKGNMEKILQRKTIPYQRIENCTELESLNLSLQGKTEIDLFNKHCNSLKIKRLDIRGVITKEKDICLELMKNIFGQYKRLKKAKLSFNQDLANFKSKEKMNLEELSIIVSNKFQYVFETPQFSLLKKLTIGTSSGSRDGQGCSMEQAVGILELPNLKFLCLKSMEVSSLAFFNSKSLEEIEFHYCTISIKEICTSMITNSTLKKMIIDRSMFIEDKYSINFTKTVIQNCEKLEFFKLLHTRFDEKDLIMILDLIETINMDKKKITRGTLELVIPKFDAYVYFRNGRSFELPYFVALERNKRISKVLQTQCKESKQQLILKLSTLCLNYSFLHSTHQEKKEYNERDKSKDEELLNLFSY